MKAIIYSTKHNRRWGVDLVAMAQAAILKQHMEVILLDGPAAHNEKSVDLVVVNSLSVPDELKGITDNLILYNFHPATPTGEWGPGCKRFYDLINGSLKRDGVRCVLSHDKTVADKLSSAGVPSEHCGVGYHKFFEVGEGDSFEENIWFIGSLDTKRRRRMIQKYGVKCLKKCFGEVRNKVCRSSGVHMNFAGRTYFRIFHGLRVIALLLSNKRAIVSESAPLEPLSNNEHWVSCPYGEMGERAVELMSDKKRREKIGLSGYEYIRESLRFEDMFMRSITKFIV